MDIKLLVNVGDVRLSRVSRNIQRVLDVLGISALGNEHEHVALARGKVVAAANVVASKLPAAGTFGNVGFIAVGFLFNLAMLLFALAPNVIAVDKQNQHGNAAAQRRRARHEIWEHGVFAE